MRVTSLVPVAINLPVPLRRSRIDRRAVGPVESAARIDQLGEIRQARILAVGFGILAPA